MPNWKKVIVSGSNAVLNNITASGAISASGLLYASLSYDNTSVTDGVVAYDTATGQLYYTGSYGSGGGIITVTEQDGTPSVTTDTYNIFKFESGQLTLDAGNIIQINAPTLDQVTDQGNTTSNSALFLTSPDLIWGNTGTATKNADSGFLNNGGRAQTHVTPQYTEYSFYMNGVMATDSVNHELAGYTNNYLVYNKGVLFIGSNGDLPSGGGGPGGGTNDDDHPSDGGGHLQITGKSINLISSGSTESPETNNYRGIGIYPSALYFFNADASASVSGALQPVSASAKIKFDTGSNAVKFFAGSTDEELKEVMHISKSGDNPRIGIGVTNPLTNFDFKDISDSRDGTKLILRTSRPTKGGNTGDEAGKINFAIDSSSYGDIQTSGSIAKILGSVTSISEQGASGKLSFEVADDNDVKQDTTEVFRLQKNPGGTVDLTYTVGVFQGSVNLNGSNSSLYAGKNVEAGGNITTTTGYVKADSLRIGTTQDPGGDSAIIAGNLILNNDFTSSGDISSSGDIIANNGSFSGNLTVDGNITANQYIVSSSVTYMTQSFSSGSTIFGDTLDDTHLFTGSVDITGSLTVDGMTYPTTDGNDGQVLLTDGSGVLSFGDVKVYAQVKNISGVTLAKGTPVHATASASPPSGNVSEVIAASSSLASSMPATFVLDEELANEAEGRAILSGFINGVDTSAFNEGDVVYVGPDGGYTTTKPTGTNLIQNLGIITKVAVNGAGYIYGSGRSNDVPNITEGYAWVGNSSGVATATSTSSFVVTTSNTASYVAAGNIDGTIDISDQTNLVGGTNLTLSGDTMNLNTNISLTSITASGAISASGTIVGSNLSGTNTGDQDLSSYSTITQLNASSSALQSNINTNTSNISSIASFTASLDPDITTLSLPASTTISTFGASLIDDTTATAARTTLGLGSIATTAIGDYVNINGDILEGDLDFDSSNNYNIINVGNLYANTISGSTFVSDGVTVVSTPDAETVKIGQSAGGSGPMRVSIVSSNTQYGLFSSTGIQLTGSVDITGSVNISNTLSIPGFADVSASLAAAGTVDTTGTPLNNHIARFTDSNTLKGSNDFTFDGSDMVIDAVNSIIVNTSNNDAYFQIKGSSDNNLLQVNSQLDDQIGIGTSTPSAKLHISQSTTDPGLLVDGGSAGSLVAKFRRTEGVSPSTDVNLGINFADSDSQIRFEPATETRRWSIGASNAAPGNFEFAPNTKISGNEVIYFNREGGIYATAITASGNISASGDITTNTISTISTTLASDSATNVDTFNTSSYTGAIYDYVLIDTTVGARAGQFMIAQDSGSVTFTDNSTRHLFDGTAPEISGQINGANVEVQVTNGNGYTFKSFVKKL